MTPRISLRDSDIVNPIINLVVWLIAVSIGLLVVIIGWSYLSYLARLVFHASTPLAGRIAIGIGLSSIGLSLFAFFIWLFKLLVRNAVVYLRSTRKK